MKFVKWDVTPEWFPVVTLTRVVFLFVILSCVWGCEWCGLFVCVEFVVLNLRMCVCVVWVVCGACERRVYFWFSVVVAYI